MIGVEDVEDFVEGFALGEFAGEGLGEAFVGHVAFVAELGEHVVNNGVARVQSSLFHVVQKSRGVDPVLPRRVEQC